MSGVDVLMVMEAAMIDAARDGRTEVAIRLVEAKTAVADLISTMQHIATFTAYQNCENCNAMCVIAHEALDKAQP